MGRYFRAAGAPGARVGVLGGGLASLLFSAAGCAQLAGIDETSGLPPGVSVRFDRVSIGAAVTRVPQDVTGQTATYLVSDAAATDGLVRVEALQTDASTWTASAGPVATGTPPVIFTLPDEPNPRMLALPSRDLVSQLGVFEHPNPTAAPSPAMVTVSATLPTPYVVTEAFELFSVGTWTRSTLPPPTVGATTLGPAAFDYTTSNTIGHARPPERITLDDVHAVLRYDGGALTGVMPVAPFEQTGDDVISGAMLAVPRDQTLDVTLAPMTLASRFMTPLPAMTASSMGWFVRAAPGAATAVDAGPVLVSGALTGQSPAALMSTYGNPFDRAGWPAVVELRASATRSYPDPVTSATATLSASQSHSLLASSLTAAAAIDVPAGMPQTVSFDATPLTTDGLMIPRPVVAPVITFTTDGASDSLYTMTISQLAPNATATALDRTLVISAQGATPSFVVPPELFQPGATYVIRVGAYSGGFTSVATGDLTMRSFPISQTFYDAGVFTVTP